VIDVQNTSVTDEQDAESIESYNKLDGELSVAENRYKNVNYFKG